IRRGRQGPLPSRRGEHALRESREGAPQARLDARGGLRRARADDGRRRPEAALMKALVTGAGGFVGSHLVRELRDAGWRVLTSDRRGDVDLPGDLLKLPLRSISVDVVFHLAGFANPSASISDPSDAWTGNAVATARVAR